MCIKQSVQQVPLALQIVYRERPYQIAALLLGLLAAAGIRWVMQLVSSFPGGGLFWDITPLRLLEMLLLSASLGLLIPMQVYVLRKSKRNTATTSDSRKTAQVREASSSRLRAFAPRLSGWLGAMVGIACLTCCAPLLFPALLALLGASGSVMLTLNSRLVQWSSQIFLGSVLLCGITLFLLARNVTAACALPSGRKEGNDREDRVQA